MGRGCTGRTRIVTTANSNGGDERHTAVSIVPALVVARQGTADAGNRRALFAQFDALLAHAGKDDASEIASPNVHGGDAVELRRIALRNWRSFEDAELWLPPIGSDRNLIVVDAPNGFGKSSILEAFALGLFGRTAVTELEMSQEFGGGRAERRRSYRSTLEGTLHRSARARDDGMCAVTLDFRTADGPVSVERRWYFEENGALIEEDEELFVRLGEDRHLSDAPEGHDARIWNQQEIERRIMPAALAPFFLFDGERLERWVDGRLSDRVRSALRRLLGLDDLSGLADDLRAYARDRDRSCSERTPDARAVEELDRLETELQTELTALDEVEKTLAELRHRRSAVLAELSHDAGGSHADLRNLLERRHRLVDDLKSARRALTLAVVEDGPLLLVGSKAREALSEFLASDIERADRRAIDPAVIERLWRAYSQIEPRLDGAAAGEVRDRLQAAASTLGGEADDTPLVDATAARAALARLMAAERRGDAGILQAAHEVASVRAALTALDDEEVDRRDAEGRRARLQVDLAQLAEAIEASELARGGAMRQVQELTSRITPMRADAERRAVALRDAEPRLQRAAAARALAARISDHLGQLTQDEHGRFAEAVTKAYRSLAHKADVGSVRIGDDGTVTLFDGEDRDVTAFRRSAGESQIFAMALIAAVGSVVGDRLPLMVDTPLARLDTVHRRNLLRMLGARQAQTILLTQPEEMTPIHREEIAAYIAGALWIDHRLDERSGVGVSQFAPELAGEAVL